MVLSRCCFMTGSASGTESSRITLSAPLQYSQMSLLGKRTTTDMRLRVDVNSSVLRSSKRSSLPACQRSHIETARQLFD